ncbi:hypothetical protein U3A55_06185 [Salarchaeum sp. III]
MATTEYVQCPTCGWTGRATDLDGTGDSTACPVCDTAVTPG